MISRPDTERLVLSGAFYFGDGVTPLRRLARREYRGDQEGTRLARFRNGAGSAKSVDDGCKGG